MRNSHKSAPRLTVPVALLGATFSAAAAWCPEPASDVTGSGQPMPGQSTALPVDGWLGDVGQWMPPQDWPVIAIHAAVLPTGQVLHYSYPFDQVGSEAATWDPVTGQFTEVNGFTDIFCSGLVPLPDGTLFVAGGNDYQCLFQGRRVTHIFDPFTHTWTFTGAMAEGRWYPATIRLGDGRVVIMTGLDRTCSTTLVMERFTPGQGLSVVPGGERFLELYPRAHLLTSGLIAHVGVENSTWTFDPCTDSWQFVTTTSSGYRWNGNSVLVPARPDNIMLIGGHLGDLGAATTTCEWIDFTEADPHWRPTGSLNIARSHANTVILPDRTVLLVGGGLGPDLYQNPVLNAELFDPETESWTLLPPQQHPRMYHATAVLLPDGRVLSAGQDSGISSFTAELYLPGYLFRGPRPVISTAPAQVAFGQSFLIDSPDATSIESVALIGLASVTHSVDINQRYVGLEFSRSGDGQLTALAPPDGNHAPPGPYMLFLVNDAGVPSEAAFVQLVPNSSGTVYCDDIVGMKAACVGGNVIVRIGLTDTSHDGESIAVRVGSDVHVVPIQGRRARLIAPGYAGAVQVDLIEPAGAVAPIVVDCP